MKVLTWWHERLPRERLVLSIAGLVAVILAVYLAIEPVLLERSRMHDSLEQLRTDLLWMKQNVPTVRSLQTSDGGSSDSTLNRVSPSVIQSIVNTLSLQDQLTDLGPGPGQSVRIQFNQISFPQLMRFLYQLKATTSASIDLARISRTGDDQAMVQASIVIDG